MSSWKFETSSSTNCCILVTPGQARNLTAVLAPQDYDGVFLVHDVAMREIATEIDDQLNCSLVHELVPGESEKTLVTVGEVAALLLAAGATRKSLIIGLGGGVTCDLVAFLASIYQRGIACALLPTTMLAMVDASVGGKNGVDLGVVKNMLGTIRQPHLIVIDPNFIETLPDEELRDGLVEVIKKAAILDRKIFAQLRKSVEDLRNRAPKALEFTIKAAIEMKLAVVQKDERESGVRKLLNFGHTVGHAIESLSAFSISHGAAVALGMRIELLMGPTPLPALLRLLKDLHVNLDLPSQLLDPVALWKVMLKDKKNQNNQVHMAVPTALGSGALLSIEENDLARAVSDLKGETKVLRPLLGPFDLSLKLPGSKSVANRAIVLAALSMRQTRIRNATPCEDVLALVNGLRALGFDVQWVDKESGCLVIQGGIPQSLSQPDPVTINCGNAGTALRFLTSIAALVPGQWILTGNKHMQKRPIKPLVDAWEKLGIQMSAPSGCPPITITGGRPVSNQVALDASISSQFLSSLLLVASQVEDGLQITLNKEPSSNSYVDITKKVMAQFGQEVNDQGLKFHVVDSRPKHNLEFEVEGCWSSAGFFFALADLVEGRFRGENLSDDSPQGDRLVPSVIESMKTTDPMTLDVSQMPDQLMNLAVLAARRSAPTHFIGAKNLRFKECDRLAITCRELKRAGIDAQEHEDGIDVLGIIDSPKTICFHPEDDHRLAMAFTAIGLMRSGCTMKQPHCVAKSFPRFFDIIDDIFAVRRPLVLIGMPASGKSTLAARLSTTLTLPWQDSDDVFKDRHGDICTFVLSHGWNRFRALEQEICQELLETEGIIALGGGALECPQTALLCREKAFVIWLNEDLRTIRNRLEQPSNTRPPLTSKSPADEIQFLDQKRRPVFEKVNHLKVPGGLSSIDQEKHVLLMLEKRFQWPRTSAAK